MPKNKVIERYYRCLDLLIDAINVSHRAYIFDNSSLADSAFIAQITEANTLELKVDTVVV